MCYLGDTAACEVFEEPLVRTARILIGECTFVEPAHRQRAAYGKHMHLDDWLVLIDSLENQHIVFTHLSRRTELQGAKKALAQRLTDQQLERLHFLMDRER